MNRPLVIVLEILFLTVFWAWCLSAALFLRNTVLPRVPITQTPEFLHLGSETVEFQATDGVRLEGWKIPGEPSRPWILLCHGVGSNRADLLDIAAGLHEAGFNLFLFDFRGHGASQGRVTSFGWQEQRDLEGALSFLGTQADIPAAPYGVYGISMGAAVALMVAARDERIGAVAADSPYPNLEESIGRHLALMYPLVPKVPFHWFVLATYRLRFGVWPLGVSPEASAVRLSPRPLLLIHGAADPRMPVEGARRIAERAGEPKELWVIDQAGHLEGFALDPAAYHARLAAFFNASLL
ncbi:MAG: alpha/beta hydrolase [Candidatus Omnitrophica bacterium]|nr:alpha/beta hydrolase [Candidatus Omnitrophota bacterium]